MNIQLAYVIFTFAFGALALCIGYRVMHWSKEKKRDIENFEMVDALITRSSKLAGFGMLGLSLLNFLEHLQII